MKDCVQEVLKGGNPCERCKCQHWIKYENELNCSLISIEANGPMMLEQVGERLGLTTKQVSKIQNIALKKLKKKVKIVELWNK